MTSLFIALAGVAWAAGLAKNSVKSKQIKDGQVKTKDIAPGGVATANLADGAVTASRLANGSVGTAQLTDGSVISAKLADGSVLTGRLADGAVTSAKLADGSIDGAKILDDTLGAVDLAPNSVAASEIADSSVDTTALQDGAVTGLKTNEPTLDIPTAWAEISDGAGNGADPILVDSEGVTAVNDGPNPGTDGVTCWNLANGFTPDLILAQSKSTTVFDAVITAVAPVTPGLGCVAGDEAQVQPFSIGAGGIRSADLYVAFFDLN